MIRTSHQRSKRSKIIRLSLLALLILGLLLVVLEKTHVTNFIKMPAKQTTAPAGPTKAEQQAEAKTNADSKQQLLDNAVKDQTSGNTASGTDTPATTKPSASMTLTASQSGSSVTALTQIQDVSEGTCKLVASNGVQSTTQAADVIYQPQFSSCAGFTVPVSSIGAGTWSITVTVTPANSAAITKTITLQVN